MLTNKDVVQILLEQHIDFITGVPCSYFGSFLSYIDATHTGIKHVAASHEGEAMGIAAGYHLGTGKIPAVYLQNSGLGNIINPLTSLCSRQVYSIPSLLFISHRGEPNMPDEPQHKMMGAIMHDLLKTLDIPVEIVSHNNDVARKQIIKLSGLAKKHSAPTAAIFRKGTIVDDPKQKARAPIVTQTDLLSREQILELLLPKIADSLVIATTGKTSRELYEMRERRGQSHATDFMVVGSMGHVASIGLGLAKSTQKKVVVIDGDGSVLMKMGTLPTIGHYSPPNLLHIVIDNGAYESTGAQPTNARVVNWNKIFGGAGYRHVCVVHTAKEITQLNLDSMQLPAAIIVRSRLGSRADLGRPTTTPLANKQEFMGHIMKR